MKSKLYDREINRIDQDNRESNLLSFIASEKKINNKQGANFSPQSHRQSLSLESILPSPLRLLSCDLSRHQVNDYEPSAPSFSQFSNKSFSEITKANLPVEKEVTLPSTKRQTKYVVKDAAKSFNGKKTAIDADGYTSVTSKKNLKSVVGVKETTNGHLFKGVDRFFDLYIGNCSVDVDTQGLIDYVLNECKIKIHNCTELKTRIPNSKAFKISVSYADREVLLTPNCWPKSVYCRKFYRSKSD